MAIWPPARIGKLVRPKMARFKNVGQILYSWTLLSNRYNIKSGQHVNYRDYYLPAGADGGADGGAAFGGAFLACGQGFLISLAEVEMLRSAGCGGLRKSLRGAMVCAD